MLSPSSDLGFLANPSFRACLGFPVCSPFQMERGDALFPPRLCAAVALGAVVLPPVLYALPLVVFAVTPPLALPGLRLRPSMKDEESGAGYARSGKVCGSMY